MHMCTFQCWNGVGEEQDHHYIHTVYDQRSLLWFMITVVLCMHVRVNECTLLYRCICMRVTAIDGLVHYACVTCVRLHGGTWWACPLWTLTSLLRVNHWLATVLDSTRESMLALCYDFWCLQGTQSWSR